MTEEHKQKISQALKGRRHPWSEKERIQKKCLCGKKFLLTPGQDRQGHGKYCSRSCYYEYREVFKVWDLPTNRPGEMHHNFKGDQAGYKAFHLRVTRLRGKATYCEKNISHTSP